jgi:hypothetical protein
MSFESVDPASFYLREAARLRELAKFFTYQQTQADLLGMAERYELLAARTMARRQDERMGEASMANQPVNNGLMLP